MKTRLTLVFVALALGACRAPREAPSQPKIELPAEFSAARAAELTPEPTETVALETWWHALGSQELDTLVDRALAQNLDLAKASARVREARALSRVEGASNQPEVDAKASAIGNRRSENTTNGAPFFGNREYNLFNLGFDAKWELDLFDANGQRIRAAEQDLAAAREQRHGSLVSLVAEVARNYVELCGLELRLKVAQESIRLQDETLEIVRARAKAGLVSDLDVARAEAQVSSSKATTPTFEADIAVRIHALGLLLGEEPRALSSELAIAAPIPAAAAALALDEPLTVVRRRPDVRAAERQCAAASARVGAATSDLYPKLSLGASFAFAANQLGDVVQASSTSGSIGPSIVWPLFDGGRLHAQVDVQTAREESALLDWRTTVLGALREVEDSLSTLAGETQRRRALSDSVQSQTRAADLARQLYASGLADFLSVLDAERVLFAAQDQLASSEAQVSVEFIALAKSLGGGWDPKAPEPDDEHASR